MQERPLEGGVELLMTWMGSNAAVGVFGLKRLLLRRVCVQVMEGRMSSKAELSSDDEQSQLDEADEARTDAVDGKYSVVVVWKLQNIEVKKVWLASVMKKEEREGGC